MSEHERLTVVGTDVVRQEATEKLTGAALYASDMVLPGMLHAKVKGSPYARARILHIDTSKAQQLVGVHAVLTVTTSTTSSGSTSSTRTSSPRTRCATTARRSPRSPPSRSTSPPARS